MWSILIWWLMSSAIVNDAVRADEDVTPFGVDLGKIKVYIENGFYNLSLKSEWSCDNCYNTSKCQSNRLFQWEFRIKNVDIPFHFICRSSSYINPMIDFDVEAGRNKMVVTMESSNSYDQYILIYMDQKHLIKKQFDSIGRNIDFYVKEKTVYRVCIAAIDNDMKRMTDYKCKLAYSEFSKTGPVTNVKISTELKKKLIISWNKPKYKADSPEGYLVSYKQQGSKICKTIVIQLVREKLRRQESKTLSSCEVSYQGFVSSYLTSLVISDLEEYSLYEVRINPINGDRESIGVLNSIWTAEGESGPVENLQIVDFKGFFQIGFLRPINPKGKINDYKIQITTKKKNQCDKVTHIDIKHKYDKIYYKSDSIYEIEVTPINGFGLGQSSQIRFYSMNSNINSARTLDFKLSNYRSELDDKYLIILHKTKYNDERKVLVLADKFTNNSIKFDNLNECTKYRVSIQHLKSNIVSEAKHNWCQYTNAPDLGRVVIKPIANNTDRIKLIEWIQEGSANNKCPIDYFIKIIDVIGNVVINRFTVQNRVRIRNLLPDMKYNVEVVSYSNAPSDTASYQQSSYRSQFYTGNELISYDEQDYSLNITTRTMSVSWSTNPVDARAVMQYFIAIKVSFFYQCFNLVIMKCRDCPAHYNETYYSKETLRKIDLLKVCVQIETRYFQMGQMKFEEEIKLNTVSNQYYIDVYAVNLMGIHLLFKQNQGILKQYIVYIITATAGFALVLVILIIVLIRRRKHPIEIIEETRASNMYDCDDELNEVYDSTEF